MEANKNNTDTKPCAPLYKSPYEAYPFLRDEAATLLCDFELATDEMASLTGLLRAGVQTEALKAELLTVAELIYHANPTLRTRLTITEAEVEWLKACLAAHEAEAGDPGTCFVLPVGTQNACLAHTLRVKAKSLVRLVYRHIQGGGEAPELLLDFCNLLSGYFFMLAMALNRAEGEDEITFTSRNY